MSKPTPKEETRGVVIPYQTVYDLSRQKATLLKRSSKEAISTAEARAYSDAVARSMRAGYVYHRAGYATQASERGPDGQPTAVAKAAAARSVDGLPHHELFLLPVVAEGETLESYHERVAHIASAGYIAQVMPDGSKTKVLPAPPIGLPTGAQAMAHIADALLDHLKTLANAYMVKTYSKDKGRSQSQSQTPAPVPEGEIDL